MSIFEGAGVALVTPFKESGEINYSKLEEQMCIRDSVNTGKDVSLLSAISMPATMEISCLLYTSRCV